MGDQAALLKEIRDHLDRVPAGGFVDAKALAGEFAKRYSDPSMQRIEEHIIDQLRERGLWPTT